MVNYRLSGTSNLVVFLVNAILPIQSLAACIQGVIGLRSIRKFAGTNDPDVGLVGHMMAICTLDYPT